MELANLIVLVVIATYLTAIMLWLVPILRALARARDSLEPVLTEVFPKGQESLGSVARRALQRVHTMIEEAPAGEAERWPPPPQKIDLGDIPVPKPNWSFHKFQVHSFCVQAELLKELRDMNRLGSFGQPRMRIEDSQIGNGAPKS